MTLSSHDIAVAVTSPSFFRNRQLQEETMRLFPWTRFNESGERLEGERLVAFVRNAEAVIAGLETFDAAVLAQCHNLRIISKYGVGLDNIDLDFCRDNGIAIGWTGGINRLSVAEMTVGFMLGLCRNLYSTTLQLKKGAWNKHGGGQLSGKTVGIIGAGNIGKKVIGLLNPFNCRIMINDIIDQQEYYEGLGLFEASKNDIFRQADIISVHTPLTDETRYMVNAETLRAMKPTAFLINTARGAIVRQDDLKQALQEGWIAGAAIDVFEEEPPTDMEFLSLSNLICTPHIGGNAHEAVVAMGLSAITHLREYFAI